VPVKPHCPTCVCDPSSPRALAYTNLIPGYKMPRDSQMFCLVASPAAITDAMAWFRAHREDDTARPATLVLELSALRAGIAIVVREPPPPGRRYPPRAKEPA
jgi:hypothetical protein